VIRKLVLFKITIRNWNPNISLDTWTNGESIGTSLSSSLPSIIVFKYQWTLLLNHQSFRRLSLPWVIIWLIYASIWISSYRSEPHTRIHTLVMRSTMDGLLLKTTSLEGFGLISSRLFSLIWSLKLCYQGCLKEILRQRSIKLFHV